MYWNTNATRIRRDLLVRIARLFDQGRLVEDIDRIPYDMVKRGTDSIRCCVHHDRAILRRRLVARLGLAVEAVEDEALPLAEHAKQALSRETIGEPVLTVIDEACHACVRSRYYVTDACQGCMARPCTTVCPRKAIRLEGGRARIDESLCVECGLCTKACRYGSIIKLPVPCEEACPVGAISKGADGKEAIDFGRCIACGACLAQCPFGAVTDRSQLLDVIRRIPLTGARPKLVVALVAPAVMAQFRAETGRVQAAIMALGFNAVLEVAVGADRTAAEEAAELVVHAEGHPLATSCCPAWVEAARKHAADAPISLSGTPSPMVFTARLAREEYPGCCTVFIGPCVAKRVEAIRTGEVDFVLSSEELGALLIARGVELAQVEPVTAEAVPSAGARGFAASQGVAAEVAQRFGVAYQGKPIRVAAIDGLNRKVLDELRSGSVPECDLLEVMTCQGGCIGGPSILVNPKIASSQLRKQQAEAVK